MAKDNNKKNSEFKMKLLYKFDEYLSRGAGMQFIMLIALVAIIITVLGLVIGLFVDGETTGSGVWQSLMHIIDQGTLGGDDTGNKLYIVIMFLATLIGMLLVGTITGIMDNALESRLDKLKEGQSKVMEDGHLLIIGFNDNINCIISEQIISNENWTGNKSIVILDDSDTDEMSRITYEKLHIDKKNSKLIFRKGNCVSSNVLDMVSACKAKAIIINNDDDFEVIRVLLALVRFLKEKGTYMTEEMPNIVTLVHKEENVSAAMVAAGITNKSDSGLVIWDDKEVDPKISNKIQIMYFENILAHIFAQVCRQPGLSWVISELFDYADSEVYIEKQSNGKSLKELGLTGKSYGEVRDLLSNSVVIGFQREDGSIDLNPPIDSPLGDNDSIIHIAEDDNEIIVCDKKTAPFGVATSGSKKEENPYNILIFGWNEPLPIILENISDFAPGSKITILAEEENIKSELIEGNEKIGRINIDYLPIDLYNWFEVKEVLDNKLTENITNIMLLCQDGVDNVEADRKTTVLLLNIRSHLEALHLEQSINVTSEMNLAEDESLLQDENINDFVVGSEMANRMMVQVANNPSIHRVFLELLDDKDSEIYLRYIEDYVDTTKPFNWQFVAEAAAARGETAIGWIKYDQKKQNMTEVKLNPKRWKDELEFKANDFHERDRLVVLAED